jgi:hypothetical protein
MEEGKMMTLDELLAQHPEYVGKQKISLPVWNSSEWAIPHFCDNCGFWVCQLQDNDGHRIHGGCHVELFTEPKPKVKRAPYWFTKADNVTVHTTCYYDNDAQFLSTMFTNSPAPAQFGRITRLEIEVEDE